MDVVNTEQSRESVVTVYVDSMYSREVCQVSVMFICPKNTGSVARKCLCRKSCSVRVMDMSNAEQS